MKKFIVGIILLLLMSCATQKNATIQRQRQGLMLQNNTDMSINKKYYDQKRSKKTKHIKHKNLKRTPKRKYKKSKYKNQVKN